MSSRGVNVQAIPRELRSRHQWVNWKYAERRGESKLTKVPINSQTGNRAKTNDPTTWSTIGAALARLRRGGVDGIGFVFNDDYVGVDLDRAAVASRATVPFVYPDGSDIKSWAREIVQDAETYTERSPGGDGLHLIVRGSLPPDWSGTRRPWEDGQIEIYGRTRFFTFTGDHLTTTPSEPQEQQGYVLDLYKRIGGPVPKAVSNGNGRPRRKVRTPLAATDGEILAAARRAQNGDKFSRLWSGDFSDYASHSEADLALCSILSFYAGNDSNRIDTLFRKSGLLREKWERQDYRERTIDKAIEETTETWTPGRSNGSTSLPSPACEPSQELATEPDGTLPFAHDIQEAGRMPTRYSDDALADRFSRRYTDALRFVPTWGWLEWDGTRWKRVPEVRVMELARPVCRTTAQQCLDDSELKPSVREGLARSLASARTVAAVERLARGDVRHYTLVERMDADLWLFNTPGGTIELKTGTLREHRRDDLITRLSNATPGGKCPRWRAFLNRVTSGNADLQAYLQRFTGYSLVGDPREESVEVCYGEGGNGKGTFLTTLQHAFGEYATTAPKETFAESRGEKHPTDIAKLAGARLVISNEVDEGQRWDEARIKNLTGRDVMTARFMRQDFFEFMPQFSLIIAGNHKPALKTVDESIRRRFHLIPFDVVIPREERDEQLKDKLRNEVDGILSWALQGCLDWQQQGLNPPEIVLAATAEYLADEDTLEMWLEECCERGQDHEEPVADLLESHRRWKQDRGEKPLGMKTFSNRLRDRGFERGHDSSGRSRVFRRLRLTSDERNVVREIVEHREAGAQRRES